MALLASTVAACGGGDSDASDAQPPALADIMEIAFLIPSPERVEFTLEGGGPAARMTRERDSTGEPYIWTFGERSLRFDSQGRMTVFISLKVRHEIGSQCATHVPIEFQRPVSPLAEQVARQRLVLHYDLQEVRRFARLYYASEGALLLDRRDIDPAAVRLGTCP